METKPSKGKEIRIPGPDHPITSAGWLGHSQTAWIFRHKFVPTSE
jgi:hypothetical protein